VLRFQYQLARALQRIDKDRAFALLEQLAKRRYPVAFDNDLRRTCCKLMTAPRCAPGHSIKGIQAAYDDRAEYQPMIDAAIQCVADEVSKIVNPAAAEQRGGA
jgi:hypothetical protein